MWIVIASVLGFLGVAAGAFGAHGLKEVLTADQLVIWETAVRYQMYHALALLAVGVLARTRPYLAPRCVGVAGVAFLIGVIIFSGSLYLLAVTDIRWLGAITPFGGVSMLVGWAALVACGFTPRHPHERDDDADTAAPVVSGR